MSVTRGVSKCLVCGSAHTTVEQYFPFGAVYCAVQGGAIEESVAIQMKAIEHYFSMALFISSRIFGNPSGR